MCGEVTTIVAARACDMVDLTVCRVVQGYDAMMEMPLTSFIGQERYAVAL
jgi:hypothetical protein